jgi:hypothetical protein
MDHSDHWPTKDEEGQFKVSCSCQKWEFVGSALEIRKEARSHDDSPWTNHIVHFVGKV